MVHTSSRLISAMSCSLTIPSPSGDTAIQADTSYTIHRIRKGKRERDTYEEMLKEGESQREGARERERGREREREGEKELKRERERKS